MKHASENKKTRQCIITEKTSYVIRSSIDQYRSIARSLTRGGSRVVAFLSTILYLHIFTLPPRFFHKMSNLLTQGALSGSEYPCTTAEITYFLEAFLIREALLAMPDDLDSNERTRYIKAIFVHVVSLSTSLFISYTNPGITKPRNSAPKRTCYLQAAHRTSWAHSVKSSSPRI